jgi:hypothetical protein
MERYIKSTCNNLRNRLSLCCAEDCCCCCAHLPLCVSADNKRDAGIKNDDLFNQFVWNARGTYTHEAYALHLPHDSTGPQLPC